MQSDRSDSLGPITQRVHSLPAVTDARGKHRIQAEVKRLEQEAKSLELVVLKRNGNSGLGSNSEGAEATEFPNILLLENELEQLENMERASATCIELLSDVETRPDPLLPVTNGPTNPLWDRWFEGPHESQGCRCWIL